METQGFFGGVEREESYHATTALHFKILQTSCACARCKLISSTFLCASASYMLRKLC